MLSFLSMSPFPPPRSRSSISSYKLNEWEFLSSQCNHMLLAHPKNNNNNGLCIWEKFQVQNKTEGKVQSSRTRLPPNPAVPTTRLLHQKAPLLPLLSHHWHLVTNQSPRFTSGFTPCCAFYGLWQVRNDMYPATGYRGFPLPYESPVLPLRTPPSPPSCWHFSLISHVCFCHLVLSSPRLSSFTT